MTEQTKRAIELTKELFAFQWFNEAGWNEAIRKPNFNPTLKTVLKYLNYEAECVNYEDLDDEDFYNYNSKYDKFYKLI